MLSIIQEEKNIRLIDIQVPTCVNFGMNSNQHIFNHAGMRLH